MKKIKIDAFILLGPFIATWIAVIIGHQHLYLNDPIRFLIGLITPSIIFPMLGMMVVAMIFGYILGMLPAYLTFLIFSKLIHRHLPHAQLKHFIGYGFCAGLFWVVLTLLLVLYDHSMLRNALLLSGLVMLPTSVICAALTWKQDRKSKSQAIS